jgi:hypothetical protein
MKMLVQATVAAFLAAAPLHVGQALAAGEMMSGDAMHPMAGDAMHAPMHMTCKTAGMTKEGMRIEFHNTGKSEVPAGAKVHWMLRGSAQGDAMFDAPVAPGGMMTQDYMMHDMMHMSAETPCTVQAM